MTRLQQAGLAALLAVLAPGSIAWGQTPTPIDAGGREGVTRPASAGRPGVTRPSDGPTEHEKEHEQPAAGGSSAPS